MTPQQAHQVGRGKQRSVTHWKAAVRPFDQSVGEFHVLAEPGVLAAQLHVLKLSPGEGALFTEDAARQYRRAIQLDMENSGLHYNLGVAYANLEDYENAAVEYIAAIDIDPHNAAAHNAAAITFYMLKDLDSARSHARTAKELGFDVQKELLDTLGE